MLLVHGWEATHVDGDAFVAPLLAAGNRVVTFDLPAHGASAGTMASIPDLADALVRVAAHVGPVDAIVAHSIGCAATSVALERGLEVRRVVFIAPPERFSNVIAELGKHANLDPLAIEAALLARGLDVPKLDLPKSAVAFTKPVLIVHSVDDRVVSVEGARRTARAWRGSELLEVEGLGHNRILRDPAVVRTAIDFIAR